MVLTKYIVKTQTQPKLKWGLTQKLHIPPPPPIETQYYLQEPQMNIYFPQLDIRGPTTIHRATTVELGAIRPTCGGWGITNYDV